MENIAKINQNLLEEIPNLSERALMLTISNNGFVDEIGSYFTNKIKNISNIFRINKDRIDEIDKKDYNNHTKRLLKQKKAIKDIKENIKYSNVAKIKVPVMLGLNKSIPEAILILQPAIEVIQNNLYNVVDDCDTIVAKMLADRDFKRSSKPVKVSNKRYEELETLRKTLGKILNPNNMKDRNAIEDLIPNISSLDGIVDNLTRLNHGNTIDKLNKIQSITKTTSKRVDALYKEFLENKDIEVDRDRVIDLAEYLEVTAEYVTISISLLQVVNQLTNTVTIIIDRLKDNI